MSEDTQEGMLTLTSDVFILNDYVYWRRVRTLIHTKKGYGITQTSRDEYVRIHYKTCSKEFITSNTFREEHSNFDNVKDVPEFVDILFGEVLEYKWLANIMYTSTIMVFDQ